jgi:hypothetical protein
MLYKEENCRSDEGADRVRFSQNSRVASLNTSDNFLERVEEVDKRAIYQLG